MREVGEKSLAPNTSSQEMEQDDENVCERSLGCGCRGEEMMMKKEKEKKAGEENSESSSGREGEKKRKKQFLVKLLSQHTQRTQRTHSASHTDKKSADKKGFLLLLREGEEKGKRVEREKCVSDSTTFLSRCMEVGINIMSLSFPSISLQDADGSNRYASLLFLSSSERISAA